MDTVAATLPGILVVDDEPNLLSLLEIVFRRRGFRVWTAGSGDDAVALYRQHQEQIGVVLLDVCMPYRDGPDTLAGLRHVNPCVQACFMSGHTGRYSVEDLFALRVARFFDKPFQIVNLAEALWQLVMPEQRKTA